MPFQQIDKKTVTLIDAICASAADDMSLSEVEHLIAGLTKVRDVQAAKVSEKAQRIQRMNAAKADPKMTNIITRTSAELKRIGFEDGVNDDKVSLTKLNEAMSAASMDNLKRMTLKTACYSLGLI